MNDKSTRGRPRNRKIDGALLNAGWESLAAMGFDGMTIDDVLARAGCGRNSFYRRFDGKLALIRDMLAQAYQQLGELPDPALPPREQLTDWIDSMGAALAGQRGRAMLSILEALPRYPELRSTRSSMRDSPGSPLRSLIRDCCSATPSDDALAFAEDTLAGAQHYHITTRQRAWTRRDSVRMVDALVGMLEQELADSR
ncbi:TetR/AcrR family transcriptional regulator [Parahaliea aestuarii]|uniref:TetR/AcrR family transcriptional regulator n=1 Tax=Parahaliea aestuarii TaxID=1852021 RepID=A0A5C8ZT53_9GAMM|nr:TetR/AcrR family transcriptional regulator [Parahaliea aestuarii]TXS91605.1 TetR/AcrR family transcriptional regulator [Parahaliea aestuarii]